MDVIKLTEQTLSWFLPILPEDRVRDIQTAPDTLALGAVWEGTACGVLVCRDTGVLVDVVYLAVSDDYRRRGVGTALLDELCRCTWPTATPVTCTFSAPDRADPLCRFFAAQPFFTLAEEEGFVCALPLTELAGSSRLSPFRGRVHNLTDYLALSPAERRRTRGGAAIPFLGDLLEDPALYRPLCLCSRDREGVSALILCTREPDGLELSLAWAAPGCQGELMGLLAEAAGRAVERGERGVLHIAAVNPESVAIVDKLFPQRTIPERFYRAVWDMELKGVEPDA